MKTLIIAVLLTVGGIQLGSAAFDSALASAKTSSIALVMEDRQAR